MEPIFLRVLIFIYRNQQCNVKWNTSLSSHFPVSNGVRQGAVSSPILFSVYINDLLVILREAGIGCHVGSFFVGCLGYADDLLLLSASRSGLQSMVNTCQKFTKKKNLKFSTNPDAAKSKTKCIVFSKKAKDLKNVSPILLNGDPLPWVQQVKHLGNVMQCDNSMKIDCTLKRGKFIGKVNSLLQEFYFADPKVKMRLMNIFASSFYGSGLGLGKGLFFYQTKGQTKYLGQSFFQSKGQTKYLTYKLIQIKDQTKYLSKESFQIKG